MPRVFKSLVSIGVGILFVYGCALLINTVVMGIIEGLSPLETMAGGGIAMGSLFLAAVAAWIRQKLE